MTKAATGIAGLDQVLHGGIPSGRTTVVIGNPGCGKTVLAMQFLTNGAVEHGEPGLMISFEESAAALRSNFSGMSFPFGEVVDKSVHLVDGRMPTDTVQAGTFDLGGLIAIASSLIAKHGIRRIAIDGIDALFALSGPGVHRRLELQRLLDWLTESRLTGIFTIKGIEAEGGVAGHFGLAEYVADGVLRLRTTLIGELSRRTISVLKMRGAGFESGEHPYLISDAGVRVLHTPYRTEIAARVLNERLSTGVERLDRMLVGGYRKGTTTLISGLPGTSKTSLGSAFLNAGCSAGERCLFIGFDEPAEQMLFDVKSIGLDLSQWLRSGLLCAQSFTTGGAIGDEHYLRVEGLIDSHQPTRVVIDPITALEKAGGQEIAGIVSERLVGLMKARGITAVFTAVSDSHLGEMEATPMRVSTIADTWIFLSFANRGGERNRTLTIIKSRGTSHSNQMREMLLSADGIDLADVYSAGGEVLLGTARMEYEQRQKLTLGAEEQRLLRELETIDGESEELKAQMRSAERNLERLAEHRSSLIERANAIGGVHVRDTALIAENRRVDPTS
jgi:circadian clock protein KaiC